MQVQCSTDLVFGCIRAHLSRGDSLGGITFINPHHTFTFLPDSSSHLAVGMFVDTLAVLFAVFPLACVLTAICPGVSASTMFLII